MEEDVREEWIRGGLYIIVLSSLTHNVEDVGRKGIAHCLCYTLCMRESLAALD